MCHDITVNFILFFLLCYFGASDQGKIYANFSGEIVTSPSVMDDWVFGVTDHRLIGKTR